MRRITLLAGAMLLMAAFALGRLSAQNADTGPEPSCALCPADYVPAAEIAAYEQVAMDTGLTDQQIRSIDVGKTNVQVALVRRGPLAEPRHQSVASHDLVTEVYYVLSGGGANLTGGDLIDSQRRPPDNRAVQFLNGPGRNSSGVRDGATYELEAGDVLVIPAGTGHQFTRIDDHITYLMVRVDPDKVVPLLDAEGSRSYLAENGQ
ncbi:MAG: AraC family ligand binding domain-containing protein [Rhodospirillaceae bacterium]|nr:AraC family ligand binding domain-containing protein [Rhodospirillaceae bacterium]